MDDFEQVKESVSLKEFADDHLQPSREHGKYVCPYCNSGGHGTQSSDGAFSVMHNNRQFTCFSCGKKGDVFDLAAKVLNIDESDKHGQLRAVADWAGIILADEEPATERPRPRGMTSPVERRTAPKPEPDYSEGRKREAAKLEAWQAADFPPEALSYLQGRGYTEDEARKLGIGWNASTRRLVLPWRGCPWYHIDRDVTGNAPNKYSKPKGDEVGPQPLYNPDALGGTSFYVVEGAFDALAIEACGFQAVALGGATNYRPLLAAMETADNRPTAILMLDRDEAGKRAQADMIAAMRERHLLYRSMHYPDGIEGKDADEMRKNDADALESLLTGFSEKVDSEHAAEEEEAYSEALKSLKVKSAAEVASDLYMQKGAHNPIKTGFPSIDNVTEGGLPVGLTVLGAVSSMGKTTLTLQLADQIAASGRPVLFVTIEQSSRELVAMSLSRYTWTIDRGASGWAVSSSSIARPAKRETWGQGRTDHLLAACEAYTHEVAPCMHIMEGTKQPSVSDVRAAAERIAAHDGEPPVVFVDYLQLMRAQDEHDTDKQAVDKNVMSLRQLARDLQTSVFCISSLNRAAYYGGGIKLDSFKESGAVEYGSDLLLGLQPADMADKLDGVAEKDVKAKASKLMTEHKGSGRRSCELVILKQRFGATPSRGLPFTFDALHSLFLEGHDEGASTRRTMGELVDIR